VPRATNRPTANSSESPGRIGNSSPHSMKITAAVPHRAQSPSQCSRNSGSIQFGMSIAICIITPTG
jgi:hypothetical protein